MSRPAILSLLSCAALALSACASTPPAAGPATPATAASAAPKAAEPAAAPKSEPAPAPAKVAPRTTAPLPQSVLDQEAEFDWKVDENGLQYTVIDYPKSGGHYVQPDGRLRVPGGGQFVHVYGQKGACDLMGDTNVYPLDGKTPPTMLADKVEEHPSAHMQAFYDCIRGTGKNPADIMVGATGALTAIMGHQAITTGKVVEWKAIAGDLS